jgi:imidazolonepropionase
MPLLIRRARVLTLAPASSPAADTAAATAALTRPRRGAALRELGVLPRGDVLVEGDKIAAVGPELPVPPGAEVLDAEERVLLPGFVDCHTHACHVGDVLGDWERELAGASAAEIETAAGGLPAAVRAVRAATRKQIAAGLRVRLDTLLRAGTTTAEVKSGLGLNSDAERKLLGGIQRAASEWPGAVVPTACLGHAVEGDVAAFTRLIVREVLPEVWHEFPGLAIDARCAADAWPVEACVRLLDRARKHGLPIRVSADQHASTGMVPEALALHARSIDHLEHASKADLQALAASETFGVMLPAASFHTGNRYARAGAFVDSGGLLALASDFGPATAPSASMPFVIALAVRHCGLTVAEAITATTVNAAAALGLADRGVIAPGLRADLVLLRHTDERQLAHEFGDNPVERVVCAGRLLPRG